MEYKLFLDDHRNPIDCATYMHAHIGAANIIYLTLDWIICRNYPSFVQCIKERGVPTFVSFDHDLADEHLMIGTEQELMWEDYYRTDNREMTGYDCAKWLADYCKEHSFPLPKWAVHSMNPVGRQNIKQYLSRFKL